MGNQDPTPENTSHVQPRRFRSFRWLGLIAIAIVGLVVLQLLSAPPAEVPAVSPVVITEAESSESPDLDVEKQDIESTQTSNQTENRPRKAAEIIASIDQAKIEAAEHPYLPLLEVARAGLKEIDESIADYEAVMVSQVFAGGKLHEENFMKVKIRHGRNDGDQGKIPFSVYTKFLKPASKSGQEAIWIDGRNDGKLVAHTTGIMNVKRFYLDPDGAIAMEGNRYPIRNIGFRNLLNIIIEIGERETKYGECTVTVKRNVLVNNRSCTVLEAVHPEERPHFEAHISRIFLDDELCIPVAYEGYLWPKAVGDDPPLLEKYYYTDIKLNIGLTDADFDPSNEAYNYPGW